MAELEERMRRHVDVLLLEKTRLKEKSCAKEKYG